MLSQGVPMLLAGDEIGHTQNGNNNTYCQDNELTWLNWELDERQQRLPRVHQDAQPDLARAPGLPAAEVLPGPGAPRLGHQGHLVPGAVRAARCPTRPGTAGYVKCLGVRLAGDLIGDVDERGEPIVDETALILLNAHHEPIPFTLPETLEGQVWECVLDTTENDEVSQTLTGGEAYKVADRSLALFFTRDEADARAIGVPHGDGIAPSREP